MSLPKIPTTKFDWKHADFLEATLPDVVHSPNVSHLGVVLEVTGWSGAAGAELKLHCGLRMSNDEGEELNLGGCYHAFHGGRSLRKVIATIPRDRVFPPAADFLRSCAATLHLAVRRFEKFAELPAEDLERVGGGADERLRESFWRKRELSPFSDCRLLVDGEALKHATVRRMLEFVYRGRLDESETPDFEQLLVAADKYDVQPLKDFSVDRLVASLDDENACGRLILAFVHDAPKLREHAVDFAAYALPAVFTAPEWIELTENNAKLAAEISAAVYARYSRLQAKAN
ncbi:Speckle-type POZ protein-like protein [Aphelenchoides fujianensis]|nr:Speckle-type POZ protein-like protein [Aphelenchoides fujianensis]